MKRIRVRALLFVMCLFCVAGAQAQRGKPVADLPRSTGPKVAAEPEAPRGEEQAQVRALTLRLVKFSGVVKEASGHPAVAGAPARADVLGITFALHEEQEGGPPLWLETQNVRVDEQGRYTVLLGATRSEGLPLELFTTGKALWLGVQVEGEAEQARVLLVSVPYALKAADAETLGGKPASAFVLADEAARSSSPSSAAASREGGEAATGEIGRAHV